MTDKYDHVLLAMEARNPSGQALANLYKRLGEIKDAYGKTTLQKLCSGPERRRRRVVDGLREARSWMREAEKNGKVSSAVAASRVEHRERTKALKEKGKKQQAAS